MYLKKLSIIFSIALLIFIGSINTTSAIEISVPNLNSNEIVKNLDFLDNSMYILIKSISTEGFNQNEVKKQINFLKSLISQLEIKSHQFLKEQRDIAATLQCILSFYNLSLIKCEDYVNSKNSSDLISSISSFSTGYRTSLSLKSQVFKAGK
ncbi:hypothetical protein [Paraclostridium bifermentans]|uniref:hypothetical protein n=1 Tax=Paraclostridium bifermentans TaxID=1490 RepID=UPI001FF1E154|nr:hypothetical protein [Paraclostridium bifermentans]UOW69087.1 hypothetical protein MTR78_06555 [Paraclostridium bifermentans]